MSGIYAYFKEKLMDGTIALSTDTINAVLIDSADYTADYATHTAYSTDVPIAARLSEAALSNLSFTGGVFDADNVTFSSVSGDPGEAVMIVNATNDIPMALITGLSFTPNGNNISCNWNASGIFKL